MIHPLPANQHFFRVTADRRPWRDVLSGQGALYLTDVGNRYNVVLQRATYVSDSAVAALAEAAFYAAGYWQDQIGKHHSASVGGPLVTEGLLWEFTIQAPPYVIDVEALAASLSWPPHVLLNPCRNYETTQHLANIAITHPYRGYSTPHPGLKVPAVRSRIGPAATASNYVFFRIGQSPSGQFIGRWRLQIEFLDLGGNPVTATTTRIDWSRPRYRLLAAPGRAPAGQAPPVPLSAWQTLAVNFL